MKLTNEMIERAKAAKSEEEVMELINSSLAELSDIELSKVVGAGHDYDNYSMAETCKELVFIDKYQSLMDMAPEEAKKGLFYRIAICPFCKKFETCTKYKV